MPILQPERLSAYKRRENRDDRGSYSLDDHSEYLQGPMLTLFQQIRTRILNLDVSVREEILKLYIAFKTDTNFVDIVPQRSRLRLTLNMRFHEIDDPLGLCKDVTNLGRWGNGDVEVGLASSAELDDVMALIRQSFEKHLSESET